MNAIDFNTFERRTPLLPVVLLIDPQRSADGPFQPTSLDVQAAVAQCRLALEFARRHGFPVAMTRWRTGRRFRGWVNGLEPHACDMVFEQPQASCYSSGTFAEMMSAGGGGHNAVLACPVTPEAWTSTVADAARLGHRITFLSDATAAPALAGIPPSNDTSFGAGFGGAGQVMTVREWMSSQLAFLRGDLGG